LVGEGGGGGIGMWEWVVKRMGGGENGW